MRRVDIHSEYYAVAREYMIRLEPEDLNNEDFKSRLAQAANLTPDEFEHTFSGVVGRATVVS